MARPTRIRMSSREAAAEVLRRRGEPMHVKDITAEVLARFDTGLKGSTPEATIGAQLYVAAREKSTFKKVAPGTFALRSAANPRRRAAGNAKTKRPAPRRKVSA